MKLNKILNNHSQIEIIDNSAKYGKLSTPYITNCTESQRMIAPNQAKIIQSESFDEGDEIFYFNFGVYIYENNYFIDDESVFILNNKLVKAGIIVEKVKIDQQQSDFFITRAMDWFIVTQSNLNWVQTGDIIIIRRFCYTEFNHDEKQYFYIEPIHIHLIINKDGIFPGDYFLLLENKIEINRFIGLETNIDNCGVFNNSEYLYKEKNLELAIKGKVYSLVKKDNIILALPL